MEMVDHNTLSRISSLTIGDKVWLARCAVSLDSTSTDEESQTGQSYYTRLLSITTRKQEYIKDHPYCLLSHIKLASYYQLLGYPDLAVGAAYKALLLADAIQDESDEYHDVAVNALNEFVATLSPEDEYRSIHTTESGSVDACSQVKLNNLVLKENRLPIYRHLISSLTMCGCYKTAASYCTQAGALYPNDKHLKRIYDSLRETVAKYYKVTNDDLDKDQKYRAANWPDSGYVRREVYPWNEHEPDRLKALDTLNELMAEVAPRLEVKVVNLPVLKPKIGDSEHGFVQQFGVFTKEDIQPGEVILDETSMLTANNRLQDALCDACSGDLPSLDSVEANQTVRCPDCEVVFCTQECYDAAVGAYHGALCEMDVEAIAKDVSSKEAAESLYSLLLLRALAMAETQCCHPLELKEVKFIWGDFRNTSSADYEYPMTDDSYHSGKLLKTLPFSFEYNIRLPFHMLEKMDIDIFAKPQYDVWVFNTLYAKFRGTASARLSGSTGNEIKGPEVGAVHPMWCLANHSCDPNVSWEWGGSIKFEARDLRVTWERDNGEMHWTASGIKKGEEVLNHYCDIDLLVHERREWMRGTLGGDCRCARCVWEANESG